MPHEYISTNAPLSAVGSAAQLTGKNEDYSEAFIQPGEADNGRHKFRVVAGGPPIIENDDYPLVVRASDTDGDDGPEDWLDSGRAFEARQEARMENGHGGSKASFIRAVERGCRRIEGKREKVQNLPGTETDGEERVPPSRSQEAKQETDRPGFASDSAGLRVAAVRRWH